MQLQLLCLLICASGVASHAVMVTPAPRLGISPGAGTKLSPFESAAQYANAGCGGSRNNDPGVQQPTLAFTPGAQVQVAWQMTIPHDNDAGPDGVNGVRIALHYAPDDSFLQNILAGGVEGDAQAGQLPVAEVGAEQDSIVETTVTLPNGKTCAYCTLQWVWSAQSDGGSYIGCSDISITTDGNLPEFNLIDSEVGNILAGVPQSPAPPLPIYSPPPPPNQGSGGQQGGGGSQQGGGGSQQPVEQGESSAGSAVIGVLLVLAAGGGAYYWYKYVRGTPRDPMLKFASKEAAAPGSTQPLGAKQHERAAASPVAPPAAPPELPEGWSSGKDPTTGVTYYYNASTKETQWTVPEKV